MRRSVGIARHVARNGLQRKRHEVFEKFFDGREQRLSAAGAEE